MTEYNINETEVLQRALDTYGSAPQIAMVFEEMSELQRSCASTCADGVRPSILPRRSPTWRSCSIK